MSIGRPEDSSITLDVIKGGRETIKDGKTWLRHKADSEAGKIDLHLLKGASVSEIARTVDCRVQRVQHHFNHLQDGPSTMKPHGLKLKQINDRWSFDTGTVETNKNYEEIQTLLDELEEQPEFEEELDINNIRNDIKSAYSNKDFDNLSETERDSLIKSRIGQGRFRNDILEYWGRKCAVTGFDVEPLLIASHIKPWRSCSNDERLDKFNGLLLTPGLDSAFDRGFITFLDDGTIFISDKLRKQDYGYLGINENQKLLKVQSEHIKYLEYHQDKVFEKW